MWNVMSGRARPTPAIVEACAELGLPVDLIFGLEMRERAVPASEPLADKIVDGDDTA
jgi:hypothetical protein